MGRELFDEEPVFRATINECDALLRPLSGWSLLEELASPPDRSRLDETEVAQPAIFALQVALAALWKSWGVNPDAVVGHSVGEIAALYVAGALDLARGGTHRLASRPDHAARDRFGPYGLRGPERGRGAGTRRARLATGSASVQLMLHATSCCLAKQRRWTRRSRR